MNQPIFDALHTLDRLNSWLRSDCPTTELMRSELKGPVYWIKTKAILHAFRASIPMSFRRVRDVKPCRVCGGSGSWFHWSSLHHEDGDPCRTCGTTGRVELRFIETSIKDLIWHTPHHLWWSSSLDVYIGFQSGLMPDESVTFDDNPNWSVNQPGRALTIEEVTRDFQELRRAFAEDVYFTLEYHYHLKLRSNLAPHEVVNEWLGQLVKRQREENSRNQP